jgi:hypothetical protein
MAGDELEEGPAIPPIQEFINGELSRMETMKVERERPRVNQAQLNDFFRAYLRVVWDS